MRRQRLMKMIRGRGSRAVWLVVIACVLAAPALAQTPAPSPETHGVERMTEIASNFVPVVKSIVESLMLKRFVWLATIFAQLVMAASFLKLMSEKMGPTKTSSAGWHAASSSCR